MSMHSVRGVVLSRNAGEELLMSVNRRVAVRMVSGRLVFFRRNHCGIVAENRGSKLKG